MPPPPQIAGGVNGKDLAPKPEIRQKKQRNRRLARKNIQLDYPGSGHRQRSKRLWIRRSRPWFKTKTQHSHRPEIKKEAVDHTYRRLSQGNRSLGVGSR